MRLQFSNRNFAVLLKGVSIALLGVALAVAVLILAKSRNGWLRPPRSAAVPFTLETEAFAYRRNPQGDLVMRTITARRSDMTTVTITTNRPGKLAESTLHVIHYPDGRRVDLIDAISAKTSWPAPAAKNLGWDKEQLRHPPDNCAFTKWGILLRREKLLGQKVDVVSTSFISTSWRAEELGCQELQLRNGYKHEGSFKLISEIRPKGLKIGEPDPRLFDEGHDYAELQPSELRRQESLRLGLPWDEGRRKQAERADQIYFAAY